MDSYVTSHHGEIIQGPFKGKYALVTLPCSLYWSKASFSPSGILKVPEGKKKVYEVLSRLGVTGEINIKSNIPEKWGLGSSTADMLAAIRSVVKITNEEEALLLASIESTDPIMFSSPVIFAPKTGEVLEELNQFPPMTIIGFNTNNKGMVTSDAKRPLDDIKFFDGLYDELRIAMQTCDIERLGIVATKSAEFMQSTRPKKSWDVIKNIARRYKACGIQIAHSGTVVGLIFPIGYKSSDLIIELRSLFGEVWTFDV